MESDEIRINGMNPVTAHLTNTTGNLGTWLQAIFTLLTEIVADHGTNKTTIDECRTAIIELIDDHATNKTTIDECRTAIIELIDDHATNKTTIDECRTAIIELIDDHATNKTTIDESRTAIMELIDDHATTKTAVDETKTLVDELHDDHATLVTWMTEVDGDADSINNYLDFIREPDGVIGGDFDITAGAVATLTGAGNIKYRIDGVTHYGALDTTITLEDSGDIVDTKWGAWRILIGRDGTVTTQDTGAQMAWDSEEDALLNLAAVAPTANTCTIGYFTIDSNGGFNIGTDVVNGETAQYVYVLRGPGKQITGMNTALGSSVVADAGAATWSIGAMNSNALGVRLAQLAAITNQAVDDADTIATTNFGGWVIVQVDGMNDASGCYLLAADGNALRDAICSPLMAMLAGFPL
jgi:hypothetical protein